MSKLQRKIKRLEKEIALDNAILWQGYSLYKQRIHTLKFVSFMMLVGFTGGYLFARHKTLGEVVHKGARVLSWFIGTSNVKSLLMQKL